MRLLEGIYWVGSGAVGISAPDDGHTYLLASEGQLALVDCGGNHNPSAILGNITKLGFNPQDIKYVLVTHAHPDHIGGCAYIQQNFGAKIVATAIEGEILERGPMIYFDLAASGQPSRYWIEWPYCKPDIIVTDRQKLQLGALTITVIATPGHAPGAVCFLTETEGKKVLFSGDTLFYKGFINILSPPLSELPPYRDSILRLENLGIDALFPGHLLWVLEKGQEHINQAIDKFRHFQLPQIKPFS